MKKTILCWLLLFSTTLLLCSSCTDDSTEGNPVEKYPKNVYPITRAGADQTINIPVNSVILNGSESTDSDKNISTYLWNKIQGPESATISTPNAVQTEVSNLIEGIYIFELTVTDSEGYATKDECTVIVRKSRISSMADIQVLLPTDFVLLEATFSDNKAIKNIVWKKTAGPVSYILESPDSLKTKVSKLEKGVYEFEISVTDTYGYTAKETAKVTVGQISANQLEKNFNNLNWNCSWGCFLEIPNSLIQLPLGSVFKVYIQRDNSSNWEEALRYSTNLPNDLKYYYILNNNQLTIIPNYDDNGDKFDDTPNIKIVY